MPTIAEMFNANKPIRLTVEGKDGDQIVKRFSQQMFRMGFPTYADCIKRNATAALSVRSDGIPRNLPYEDREMLRQGFKRDELVRCAKEHGVDVRVKMV